MPKGLKWREEPDGVTATLLEKAIHYRFQCTIPLKHESSSR